MREFFERILKSISDFFSKMTRGERIRLGVIASSIILLAVIIVALLGRVNYAILYSGTDTETAAQIIAALQEMPGEKYKVEGNAILVDEDRVSELRVQLNSSLGTGVLPDTSIYDKGSSMTSTDSDKQFYSTLQLKVYIEDHIEVFDKISKATVTIVPATQSQYAWTTNAAPASAAVTLVVANGQTLTQSEANAVFDVVKETVEGIEYENIKVTDSSMRSYYYSEDGYETSVTSQLALENAVREDLENKVLNLLAPVYGVDAIRPVVNVKLGFDDVVSEEIVLAPPVQYDEDGNMINDQGMIVSSSEVFEASRTDDAAAGVAGTDTNNMGSTDEYPYGDIQDGETYRSWVREINYDMNRTTTQIKKAKGYITELSIAVNIDSAALKEDYTDEVRELIAMAIGADEEYVSVQRLPFAEDTTSQAQAEADEAAARRAELFDLIKKGIFWFAVLMLALMLLLFLRSVIKAVRRQEPEMALAGGGAGANFVAGGGDEQDILRTIAEEESRRKAELADISSKNETVQNIEKMIDMNSEAVTQLLRNWLMDE